MTLQTEDKKQHIYVVCGSLVVPRTDGGDAVEVVVMLRHLIDTSSL